MTVTIHMPAIFHTICSQDFSHCAFTGKVLRFPKMVQPFGYRVIEYGTEGSESEAAEHVVLMTQQERESLLSSVPLAPGEHLGAQAIIGSPIHKTFEERLIKSLKQTVSPGDIIAHPFGRSHAGLVQEFPEAIHVETGIGYPDAPFGAYRIFESEAWRHHHWGMHQDRVNGKGDNRLFSWVIPNYYDLEDWPFGDGSGEYALFMGRFVPIKGIHTIRQILEAYARKWAGDWDARPIREFHFAGTGDWQGWLDTVPEGLRRYCVYHGNVTGRARAELAGKAAVALCPSNFIEPFCGSAVECMLTGTPVLAPDFGAFTETVIDGLTGFRCKVLGDWVAGLNRVQEISRRVVSGSASKRYRLGACGEQYDRAFQMLQSLVDGSGGWNSLTAQNPCLV
jgi:glycosyltransferase involved in cell wall biosynthesis